MATYDELREALHHISDVYGDPNAWQRGLAAQDVADIDGYLNAATEQQPAVAHGNAGGHLTGIPGWVDPVTHKVYVYHPTSTASEPQVPDTLIGALRNHFPGLFGPAGQPIIPPSGHLPPLPATPQPGSPGRPTTPSDPPAGSPDPGTGGLPTGEQQSGRTADAVRKLQSELAKRFSQISAAEEQLSEAVLNAHATTAEGQRKLNDIQQKIIAATDNPAFALDTPAGQTQFLKFLRTQVGAIADVVSSGAVTAADQARTVRALADLYTADPGDKDAEPSAVQPEPAAPQQEPTPSALSDPNPIGPLGDPSLPLGGDISSTDPLPLVASTLPAALGAFPPATAGGPLDGLGGLASELGDLARHDPGGDTSGDHTDAHGSDTNKPPDQTSPPPATAPASGAPPVTEPAAGPPGPSVGAGAPGSTSTTVELPDGSTARAATPAAAEAVSAYLAGTPLDTAYRQAGVELPPPGTPVTSPIDPSQLSAGDLGMFKDHYVVALSTAKAFKDGQVVALSSVASGPDFLGWMRPFAAPLSQPVTAPAAPPNQAPVAAAPG